MATATTKTTIDQDIKSFQASCKGLADAIDSGDADNIAKASVAVQKVYGDIHGSRQGKVQAKVLVQFLPIAEAILELVNNLPKSTTSRTKDKVDSATKNMVVAYVTAMTDDMVGTFDYLHDIAGTKMATVDRDAVKAVVVRLNLFAGKMAVGNDRQSFDRSKEALFAIAPVGTVLTGNKPHNGGTAKATVLDDGKVQYGNQKLSLSAAAGKVLGRNQNGWDFWRVDGTVLAKKADA